MNWHQTGQSIRTSTGLPQRSPNRRLPSGSGSVPLQRNKWATSLCVVEATTWRPICKTWRLQSLRSSFKKHGITHRCRNDRQNYGNRCGRRTHCRNKMDPDCPGDGSARRQAYEFGRHRMLATKANVAKRQPRNSRTRRETMVLLQERLMRRHERNEPQDTNPEACEEACSDCRGHNEYRSRTF